MPVSSSAQLTLLPWLARWEPEPDRTTFAASLHAGSALGLALALRNDHDRGTTKSSVIAAVPAAVAGALLHRRVEAKLGGIGPTAGLLAAAGAAMWVADRRPSARDLTPADTQVLGLAQVAALAPGVSRSGVTLTVLRMRRVDRVAAMRFSLHSSLPIAIGAAGLTAVRARRPPEVWPTAAAAIAAFATARALPSGSQRVITGAAIYRLAVAALVARQLRQEKL